MPRKAEPESLPEITAKADDDCRVWVGIRTGKSLGVSRRPRGSIEEEEVVARARQYRDFALTQQSYAVQNMLSSRIPHTYSWEVRAREDVRKQGL